MTDGIDGNNLDDNNRDSNPDDNTTDNIMNVLLLPVIFK